MSGPSTYQPQNGFLKWLETRLPIGGRSLRFDYGYVSLGDLENMQVFSFELGR